MIIMLVRWIHAAPSMVYRILPSLVMIVTNVPAIVVVLVLAVSILRYLVMIIVLVPPTHVRRILDVFTLL